MRVSENEQLMTETPLRMCDESICDDPTVLLARLKPSTISLLGTYSIMRGVSHSSHSWRGMSLSNHLSCPISLLFFPFS